MQRPHINEDFDMPLADWWHLLCPNGGEVQVADSTLRLLLPETTGKRYSNAQIDDYGNPLAPKFRWRPPLRMELRASASHPAHPPTAADARDTPQTYLHGTAGFGFWNTLLTLGGGRLRLPEALWFFAAAPPSNMALVPGSIGWGWKAQVVHAQRWGALAALLPTAAMVGWARLTRHEAAAARWVQRFSGASEAHLAADLSQWHDYALEWRTASARFLVDNNEVLRVDDPPQGPLGFVAWVDNQYAVVTPRGTIRFGTVSSAAEWLALDWLRITPL